jgi:hypothetical protein
MERYMMATEAHHQLGEISRYPADICRVYGETRSDYIGVWLKPFICFINVHFPKKTTRELTAEEEEHLVPSKKIGV